MVEHLNDENFASEIESGVVLVDFTAAWCGPCKMLAPILDELENDFAGKAKIVKVDVDESQQTTVSFGVTNMPTLILFKDGKEVERLVGLRDKEMLEKLINSAL